MICTSKPIEIQFNFILNVPGQNLKKEHIVFTVKKIILEFLNEFDFLINKKTGRGRPKDYETDELLGLIVFKRLNNKNSCRELADWTEDNDETCNYYSK